MLENFIYFEKSNVAVQVANLMYKMRIPDKIAIPVLDWFEERIHE